MASALQSDVPASDRYYVKTGTVDGLRKVSKLIIDGTPILLDDVTPASCASGTRFVSTETLKHMCNVQGTEVVDQRYSDLTLPDSSPRIFTSNAVEPSAWCKDLPVGIQHMSSEARRRACTTEANAILKRTCFALVSDPVVPGSKRAAYWDSRGSEASRKLARVFD